MDWIHLAQCIGSNNGLMSTVMNLRLLLKAGNFLTSLVTVSFSSGTLLHGVGLFLCGGGLKAFPSRL
jgi:hypothetical protein